MVVTKYIQVELDPNNEVDEIMVFIKDSLNTDKETRFRPIKSAGPYTTFLKAEYIDATVEDLIRKEQ